MVFIAEGVGMRISPAEEVGESKGVSRSLIQEDKANNT